MPKYGMVIDLQKCVGCGACSIACKSENGTRARANGQSYNWGDLLITTEGTFPAVRHTTMPVMCNHCSKAACVEACPVTPKAMYKAEDGTTMHDASRCIGCRSCQLSCPYSSEELDDSSLTGASYSVISFNFEKREPQPQWADSSELIRGCTASGAEVAKRAGAPVPYLTAYAGEEQPLRRAGVVEKCLLCRPRTARGLAPACVEACPAQARVFGDQADASSPVAQVLARHRPFRLKEQAGTEPNVYYVRKFGPNA